MGAWPRLQSRSVRQTALLLSWVVRHAVTDPESCAPGQCGLPIELLNEMWRLLRLPTPGSLMLTASNRGRAPEVEFLQTPGGPTSQPPAPGQGSLVAVGCGVPMELLNEIWHLLRPPTPGCTPELKLLLTPGAPRSQPALIAAAGRGRACRGLRQSQC